MVVLGSGFRDTLGLACKFGPFWSKSTYLNGTAVLCHAPELHVPDGDILPLSVTFNGEDFASVGLDDVSLEVTVAEAPVVTRITPVLLFVGEADVVLVVEATGLVENPDLTCSLAGVRVPGRYREDPQTG